MVWHRYSANYCSGLSRILTTQQPGFVLVVLFELKEYIYVYIICIYTVIYLIFLSFENFICCLMFRSIPIPSSPTPQCLCFPPSYSSSLPSLNPPSAACMCMGVGSSTGAKVTPDTVLFNTLWWAWRCCLRLYTMGTNPSPASLWCQEAPVLGSNRGSHCLLWQFWLQLSPVYFAHAPLFGEWM